MITMHPGEYLAKCYVEPLKLAQTDLASHLQVSKSAVSRLLSGEADLSPEMAVRLSYVFVDFSAEAWMAMQTKHSLKLARAVLDKSKFDSIPLPKVEEGSVLASDV